VCEEEISLDFTIEAACFDAILGCERAFASRSLVFAAFQYTRILVSFAGGEKRSQRLHIIMRILITEDSLMEERKM
jgi:hypothetical protein